MSGWRPDHLILHDYGVPRDVKLSQTAKNPYHALVHPDGTVRYRNQENPYGAPAPHAYKMNPRSIGLSYAGPVGGMPTAPAMRALQSETEKIQKLFPHLRTMTHGEAYQSTRGTPYQASRQGRGLEEASWASVLRNRMAGQQGEAPFDASRPYGLGMGGNSTDNGARPTVAELSIAASTNAGIGMRSPPAPAPRPVRYEDLSGPARGSFRAAQEAGNEPSPTTGPTRVLVTNPRITDPLPSKLPESVSRAVTSPPSMPPLPTRRDPAPKQYPQWLDNNTIDWGEQKPADEAQPGMGSQAGSSRDGRLRQMAEGMIQPVSSDLTTALSGVGQSIAGGMAHRKLKQGNPMPTPSEKPKAPMPPRFSIFGGG